MCDTVCMCMSVRVHAYMHVLRTKKCTKRKSVTFATVNQQKVHCPLQTYTSCVSYFGGNLFKLTQLVFLILQ